MDKNGERYKQLCKHPKFVRRETRLWYQALQRHNLRVILSRPAPKPPSIDTARKSS